MMGFSLRLVFVMSVVLTRQPSSELSQFEITFVERQTPDVLLAAQQHAAYCEHVRGLGHTVTVLGAAPELPDSIFVEDVAVLFPELAVLTRPGALSRQPEVALIAKAVGELKRTVSLTEPATLEGGDVLRIGRKVFVGQTTRTNAEGIRQLAEHLAPYGYQVIPVPVHGCLHLKTGVTALDGGTLLVNTAWLDTTPFAGFRIIPVEEGEPWAANVLRLGQDIVMNAASPKTLRKVQDMGYDASAVNISEFMKMEAGLTCMSLICD